MKTRLSKRRRTVVGLVTTVAVALTLVVCRGAVAEKPPILPSSITASYDVRMGPTALGSIEKTLLRDGDVYRVSSNAKPNPLVKLVAGGEAHEEAVFILTAEGLQSVFYSESRSGKPDRRVSFDWDKRTLTFDRGGEITTESVPSMETVDASSLPFYLMLKSLDELDGKRIAVVTGKRIGQYLIEKPVAEQLETKDGLLQTWRIVKNRIGSADRAITVWVDPARSNLPVKITQKRGDRVTTLTLASINGI